MVRGMGAMVFDSGWATATDFVGVHVGYYAHARRVDGSIVGLTGWALVTPPLAPGLRYERLDGFGYGCVALRSDGAAVAWGYGSLTGNGLRVPPAGTSYVAVAGGDAGYLMLR